MSVKLQGMLLEQMLDHQHQRVLVLDGQVEGHSPFCELFPQSVVLGTGKRGDVDQTPSCCNMVSARQSLLPFQDQCFDAVIIAHQISTAQSQQERQLIAEACRVLDESGFLYVLGLNRYGWRAWRQELPGIRTAAVARYFRGMNYMIHAVAGAGLMGREKPGWIQQGWLSLTLPVSDYLALKVQCADKPANAIRLSPLKADKFAAGTMPVMNRSGSGS